ncbi:hypothetical protein JNB11_03905 [Kocuria palustris]|nr:hypothetical protein [Kocuria palustris]
MAFSRTEISTPDSTRTALALLHPYSPNLMLPIIPKLTPKMVTLTPIAFGYHPDTQEILERLQQMMSQVLELKASQQGDIAKVHRNLQTLNEKVDQLTKVALPPPQQLVMSLKNSDTIYVEELYCLELDYDVDRELSIPDYLYMESDPRTALFIEEFSDDENEDSSQPPAGVLLREPLAYWDIDDELDDGYVSHLDDDFIFG